MSTLHPYPSCPSIAMSKLPRQIWILALGRLLSEIGSGFTLFYAPIFFVQQVGLSATAVGLALGSASISGIAGRLISGTYADRWGRKPMLLLATAVLAIACGIFTITTDFPTLVAGCLVQGFGLGLYWPANEAIVADLTTGETRRFAYAITRLADNVGMGLGIIAGGLLISSTGAYRSLFIIDGISFCCFLLTIALGIRETLQSPKRPGRLFGGYTTALRDRRLLVYVVVNVIFTIYISQTQTTLPLYFSGFVPQAAARGFSPQVISALFTGHLLITIAFQLPILKLLEKLSQARSLMISGGVLGTGIWLYYAHRCESELPTTLGKLGLRIVCIGDCGLYSHCFGADCRSCASFVAGCLYLDQFTLLGGRLRCGATIGWLGT